MLAVKLGMLGHEVTPMEDAEQAVAPLHLHGLPDQGEGHGVAIGVDVDQPVAGDDTCQRGLEPETRLAVGRHQGRLFLGEAVDRPLVGRAMDPHIRDRVHPLGQLLVQVDVVDELAPGQEVALEVLHPGLDLALGLGAVGEAEPGLETPVLGESTESRIPDDAPLLGALAHRPGPIVEMLAGVTAEMLEGPLVGVEELGHGLVGTGLVEAAPAEAPG